MTKLWRRPARSASAAARTSTTLTLSAADLAALGELLAAGQVLQQRRAPVISRVKAAMTRLGLPIPVGL